MAFFEKINNDPALKGKFDEILNKHEASRDKNAVATDLSELAKAEGFKTSPEEILNALTPMGKLNEAELEAVSGGGSGLALCFFTASSNDKPRKISDGYEVLCSRRGLTACTWAGCRCWGTSHCHDGIHKCEKDGNPVFLHGLTI